MLDIWTTLSGISVQLGLVYTRLFHILRLFKAPDIVHPNTLNPQIDDIRLTDL